MITAFVFSYLLAVCFGQLYIIDDYTVDQSCSLTLNENLSSNQPNAVIDSFRQGSVKSIIGGERDMEMRVFTGSQGNRFTSDVNFGGWTVANPTSSSTSITTVQYDGIDSSFSLNITGLNLEFSSGSYLSLDIRSNGQSQITISLFDTRGGSCNGIIPIRSSSSFQQTSLPISQLSGNCDLGSIGAIETSIYSFTSINSTMESFAVDSASMSSVSPTPTPTPSSSRANSNNTKTIIIDDFSVLQQAIVTLSEDQLPTDPNLVQTSSMTGPSSSIIGGERDMELRVYSGLIGRTFTSEVSNINYGYFLGEWSVHNPKGPSSNLATNQYDGVDGSFSIDISGLNGIDISNSQLVFYAVSNVDSSIIFTFYDSKGGICDCVIGIPITIDYDYTYDEIKYVHNLNHLDGLCDKSSIGAIEYSIQQYDTITFHLKYVAIEKFY